MATLAPGRVIGDYLLLRPLSQGGFGEVYEARDQRTQHRVALKVIHRERMSEAMLAKFTHEALISNRVSESSRFVPKVVRADVDHALGRAWLAMEFIDGPTLAAAAAQGQRWSPREVIEVLYCVADALTAAHASDLVHCDIKPDNVVIQRSPTPERTWVAYVLDFGIARLRTDHSTRAEHDGSDAPVGRARTNRAGGRQPGERSVRLRVARVLDARGRADSDHRIAAHDALAVGRAAGRRAALGLRRVVQPSYASRAERAIRERAASVC